MEESDKKGSVTNEEGRYYAIGHSKVRLDKSSQYPLRKRQGLLEGRALVPKQILLH